MARSYRHSGGGVVNAESEGTGGQNLVEDTGVTPGAWCARSWKAVVIQNFNGAYAPMKGDGSAVTFDAGSFADHIVMEDYFCTSGDPADPVIEYVFAYTVSAPDTDIVIGSLERLTDGTYKAWGADLSTVVATFDPNYAPNTWYARRVVQERVSSTSYRFRMWIVPLAMWLSGDGWGSPIFDYSNATLTAAGHSGCSGGQWYNRNYKGAANPGITNWFVPLAVYEIASDADLTPRPMRHVVMSPNEAVYALAAWTTTDAGVLTGPDYTGLIEFPPDTTSYDEDPGAGSTKDNSYALMNFDDATNGTPLPPEPVLSIYGRVHPHAKNVRMNIYEGGALTNSTGATTADAWTNLCRRNLTPPTSGGVWTAALINATQAAVRRSGATSGPQITRAHAVGLYVPDARSLVVPNRRAVHALIGR